MTTRLPQLRCSLLTDGDVPLPASMLFRSWMRHTFNRTLDRYPITFRMGLPCGPLSTACMTRGYITVTPELRLEVSRRLKDEYDNGKVYYAMAGERINVPNNTQVRPSKAALVWHAQNVFR